ncbi:MAG TPA: BadF/BadG/BcrA/BcrD ATPase family protein [Vicinamibacteria bacterium]|nr:BadF/BadG/BcrA/BcrD ATPase family protein [Vicinamibacteria bacterium]
MPVLGIDAGATKTECWFADDEGALLNRARGPGVNFQLIEEDEIEFTLDALIRQTVGARPLPVDCVCVGMAGAGRERDFTAMRTIFDRLRLAREVVVTHDARIALVAGAGKALGLVLIVGTGAAAYGVNARGATARAGGWGPLLGDEGSAYWMGVSTLRAVMRAYDGRAQPTLLEDLVLSQLGLSHVEAIVHRVYREMRRDEIAALAPLVQRAADLGDAGAQSIVDQAVHEFVRAAESVIGKLDLAGENFRLVLSGGLWKAVPVLQQDFEKLIKKVAPWAQVAALAVEPAHGAIRLALDHLRRKER